MLGCLIYQEASAHGSLLLISLHRPPNLYMDVRSYECPNRPISNVWSWTICLYLWLWGKAWVDAWRDIAGFSPRQWCLELFGKQPDWTGPPKGCERSFSKEEREKLRETHLKANIYGSGKLGVRSEKWRMLEFWKCGMDYLAQEIFTTQRDCLLWNNSASSTLLSTRHYMDITIFLSFSPRAWLFQDLLVFCLR